MANIIQQLADFRMALKNEISDLLSNLYIKQYGQQPNWQEDEEIVIDDSNLPTYRISVEVDDTYSDSNRKKKYFLLFRIKKVERKLAHIK